MIIKTMQDKSYVRDGKVVDHTPKYTQTSADHPARGKVAELSNTRLSKLQLVGKDYGAQKR